MLPKEIKKKRIELCLTQSDLAQRFGVETNTIARWERGVIIPKAQGMLSLAFKTLEIEKGLNDSNIETLQKNLSKKIERLRIRHKKNKSDWENIDK
jgi:transcriptional regulator with XRE-family HTH domain